MKGRGKRTLADVICYCKMTSVMALDDVTSFYAGKPLQMHVHVCDTVQLLVGFPQCNGRKLEEAEYLKCIVLNFCVLESK